MKFGFRQCRQGDLPAPRHKRRKRFGGEEGNSLVEFAIVLPMFLTVVTGLAACSITLANQLALIQATGAGGQYLQQIRTSTTDPCKDTLTAIEDAAPNLAPSSISLSINMNGQKESGSSCSGDQSYLEQGTFVTVSTTYPCAFNIYAIKFTTACQLSASVTEYEY